MGVLLGCTKTHFPPSTDRHRWGYCWDVPQSTLYLHVQQTYCELLIKGTFLHFAFHLLCPRQTHLLLVDEPSCAPANTPLELGFILLLFIFTHAMSMVTLNQAVTALFCHQFTCYCGLITLTLKHANGIPIVQLRINVCRTLEAYAFPPKGFLLHYKIYT